MVVRLVLLASWEREHHLLFYCLFGEVERQVDIIVYNKAMKKILIIEDEPTLGEVLQKKFEAAGFEVSLIRQSLETLNFIKKTKPDIILLDLFMPILNGFEILKYKKLDPEISDIPVIVMTNSLQSTQEVEIKPLGVARFLIKANLTPKDIVDEVNNIFSLFQKEVQ